MRWPPPRGGVSLEHGECGAARFAQSLAAAQRTALGPLLAALSEPEAQGGGRAARAAAYRLLRVARNLECYARLCRPMPGTHCCDLAAVCTAVCEAAQLCCARRALRPALAASGGVLPVEVPACLLAEVALNLLDNALLYGGERPAAQMEISRQGKRAVLVVRDAGPGIPPAAQRRAFVPFAVLPRPARAAGEERGAGLGLGLAAMLARQAGGVCSLASRPGHGAAVALALPLVQGAMPGPCPTAAELLADRYSPVYVQLCQVCVLPD